MVSSLYQAERDCGHAGRRTWKWKCHYVFSCFLSLILYNVWADEPLDWSYALMRVFPPQRFEASWQPFNSFSQSLETAVEFHVSCVLLLKGRLGHLVLVLISACHVTLICPPRLLVNTPISNFPLLKVPKVIPLVSFNAIVISICFEGEGILSETPRGTALSQGRKGRVPRWAFGEMALSQANLGRKPRGWELKPFHHAGGWFGAWKRCDFFGVRDD